MAASRLDPRAVCGLGAVAAIWATAWTAVALAAGGPGRATISIAAAIDFAATAGLALYAIAVRRGHLPRWTLGATVALGLVFARIVLGSATGVAVVVGLALELGMIGLVVIRGRRARRGWRLARARGASVVDALTEAFAAARMPARLASVVATEAAVLAMVVTGWRRPARSPAVFTVHREAGWATYAAVLVLLLVVEELVVHVALAAYVSTTVAWVVTALTIYSALWVVGDALALRHGGVIVGEDGLELRIGVRWRGRVPMAAIASIERCQSRPAGAVDVSILGANVLVTLRAPCALRGLLGRRRDASAIALSIDDVAGFVAATERSRRGG